MFEQLRSTLADLADRIPKALRPAEPPPPAAAESLAGRSAPERGVQQTLRAYSQQSSLRAVVHRISNSVASTEWELFGTTRSPQDRRAVRDKVLQRAGFERRAELLGARRKQATLQEIVDHPMLELLDYGCAVLSGHSVLQVGQSHMELAGEAFQAKARDARGLPVGLWPMVPHWVKSLPSASEPWYEVVVRGQRMRIPVEDMIALKDPNPENPYLRGTSQARALADELDTDEYAAQFIKAFFYNHALPDAVVGFQGASEESVTAVRQKWDADHRGPKRAHTVRFVNYKPEVVTLGQSFKDQQIVELRGFLEDMVGHGWGVPPEILGIIKDSKRATIHVALYLYALLTIVPRVERWRSAYQRQLAPDFDDRLVVGYVSPVPEDKEHQLAVAKEQPYALVRDEWREMAGQERLGGDVGNSFLQPMNLYERPADGGEPTAPPGTGDSAERARLMRLAGEIVEERLSRLDAQERAVVVRATPAAQAEEVLEVLRPEPLVESTRDLWSEDLEEWIATTMTDLGVAANFDMFNPLIREHLSTFSGTRIRRINATTRDRIRAALVEGFELGEHPREMRKRVQAVFAEASDLRAVTIARTEVIHSAGFGTWRAHDLSGIVKQRQWVSTPDTRTRDAHKDMNGQVVAIDAPFVYGANTTMYPGGWNVAELDINCRCTMIAVFQSGPASYTQRDAAEAWKLFDRRATVWERKAREAFRQAFAEQEALVLEQLTEVMAP